MFPYRGRNGGSSWLCTESQCVRRQRSRWDSVWVSQNTPLDIHKYSVVYGWSLLLRESSLRYYLLGVCITSCFPPYQGRFLSSFRLWPVPWFPDSLVSCLLSLEEPVRRFSWVIGFFWTRDWKNAMYSGKLRGVWKGWEINDTSVYWIRSLVTVVYRDLLQSGPLPRLWSKRETLRREEVVEETSVFWWLWDVLCLPRKSVQTLILEIRS